MKEPFDRLQKDMKEHYFKDLEFGDDQQQKVIKRIRRRQKMKDMNHYGHWFLSAAAAVCLFFLSLSFVFSGHDTSTNGQDPFVQMPINQEVRIKGQVKLKRLPELYATFYVKSNLPEGAIVHLDIVGKQKKTVTVGENGYFSTTMDMPEFDDFIKFKVVFKPSEQTEAIKKEYGNRGQRLSGDYVFGYKKDNVQYYGARAYCIFSPFSSNVFYKVSSLYSPGNDTLEDEYNEAH